MSYFKSQSPGGLGPPCFSSKEAKGGASVFGNTGRLFYFCGRAVGFCRLLCFVYGEEPLVSVGSFGHFDGSKTCGRLLVTRIQGADEMRV